MTCRIATFVWLICIMVIPGSRLEFVLHPERYSSIAATLGHTVPALPFIVESDDGRGSFAPKCDAGFIRLAFFRAGSGIEPRRQIEDRCAVRDCQPFQDIGHRGDFPALGLPKRKTPIGAVSYLGFQQVQAAYI